MLILKVTTTLRRVSEETVIAALAITRERLGAETEIGEILDIKRVAVWQARTMP
jgi:hypothetical protein